MDHYGRNKPPLNDATKVIALIIAFWGANDWLADPLVSLLNIRILLTVIHVRFCEIVRYLARTATTIAAELAHSAAQPFLWVIHVKEYVNDGEISAYNTHFLVFPARPPSLHGTFSLWHHIAESFFIIFKTDEQKSQ